jgi:transposase
MMTMWPRSSHAVPAATAQVARAAFPKGCLAIRIRDALGEPFEDTQFAGLFAVRGRPAVSPARLALVLVLQFVEGLSDRQAADAVRGRIDWKYALGLELTDTGFDASVLSEFRARLLGDDQAERLLGRMLKRLREQGLMVRGGRQRTDATCVVAAVRELNRLELVTETLRAALEALAAAAPEWLIAMVPEDWYERYGQRASDYRLPQAEAARAALAVTAGADGFALLEAVHAADAPGWLWQVPAVQTLRAVWIQQYYRDGQGLRWRGKGELPPAALAIDSPYDTDARYGIKRSVGWRGYKAHFTETSEPDRPHLIVHVATTVATTADVDTMPARHRDLASTDLLPDEHLVDAGYVSVDGVLAARADYGIELVGPLPPDSGWQARDEGGFDLTRSTSTGTASRSPAPTARPPATGATAPAATGSHRAGDLPRLRLHALPRPSPLHPRAHQPPASHLPTPPPVRDPAPAPRRAGHPGLARPLRPPLRDRGHHRPGHPPQRPPPGPLPRPGQDPPAARADRAGPQPDPR